MGAKQVTVRQGAVELVASAAETHADRVREKFDQIFSPYLEPKEKLPDMGLVLTLVARRMRALNTALVEKSDAYDRELADDAEPRARRDAAVETLMSEVMESRYALESAFGLAIVRELGLEGKTEAEPKTILAKGKRLVSEIKDPKRKWPKPQRKGVKVDPTAWIDDLEAPIKDLEKAQVDVARELREAQAAGDAKARAMTENDDAFGRSASFFSKTFSLLMDDTLAGKVRPSARRPGRVIEEEEESPPEEGGGGPTGG